MELWWPTAWSIGESKFCSHQLCDRKFKFCCKMPFANNQHVDFELLCRLQDKFRTVCRWVGDAQVAVGPKHFLEIFFITKYFRATFHTVRRWVGEAREGAGPTSPSLILIGCKLDLVEVKMGDDTCHFLFFSKGMLLYLFSDWGEKRGGEGGGSSLGRFTRRTFY